MNTTTYALLAAGAGACIAFQAAANNRLRSTLDAPGIWASYFSIIGTIVFSTLAMLALQPPAPKMETVRNSDWWSWIGGPLGALIVLAGTMLVQHLGAALFIAFVVAGQLLSSLVLDHFALMGLPASPLTPSKAIGAGLVVAGVVVMKVVKVD
jgi:transporter family-2 protein